MSGGCSCPDIIMKRKTLIKRRKLSFVKVIVFNQLLTAKSEKAKKKKKTGNDIIEIAQTLMTVCQAH